MAKMIILDTKCKEDLKWSLCEEEKLFSGENVNEKYTSGELRPGSKIVAIIGTIFK